MKDEIVKVRIDGVRLRKWRRAAARCELTLSEYLRRAGDGACAGMLTMDDLTRSIRAARDELKAAARAENLNFKNAGIAEALSIIKKIRAGAR